MIPVETVPGIRGRGMGERKRRNSGMIYLILDTLQEPL
jgi:hypothetical protein